MRMYFENLSLFAISIQTTKFGTTWLGGNIAGQQHSEWWWRSARDDDGVTLSMDDSAALHDHDGIVTAPGAWAETAEAISLSMESSRRHEHDLTYVLYGSQLCAGHVTFCIVQISWLLSDFVWGWSQVTWIEETSISLHCFHCQYEHDCRFAFTFLFLNQTTPPDFVRSVWYSVKRHTYMYHQPFAHMYL